jgi:hypothetical protein
MSSEIELKPCPFCGGNELFRTADNINATDRINCKACKANNVLWKWNTHAPRIISVEELEKGVAIKHGRMESLLSCLGWRDTRNPRYYGG